MRGRSSYDLLRVPLILGSHLPSCIHFRPSKVTMHIDPARHHDQSAGIHYLGWTHGRIIGRRDDSAVLNPNVTDLTVNVVDGIMNTAAGNLEQVRHWVSNGFTDSAMPANHDLGNSARLILAPSTRWRNLHRKVLQTR